MCAEWKCWAFIICKGLNGLGLNGAIRFCLATKMDQTGLHTQTNTWHVQYERRARHEYHCTVDGLDWKSSYQMKWISITCIFGSRPVLILFTCIDSCFLDCKCCVHDDFATNSSSANRSSFNSSSCSSSTIALSVPFSLAPLGFSGPHVQSTLIDSIVNIMCTDWSPLRKQQMCSPSPFSK